MKIRNLTEESTIPEDIAHIARNAYVGKIEDRSYTRNTKPTQDIIVQAIANVTTDIKITKQKADIEMTPI